MSDYFNQELEPNRKGSQCSNSDEPVFCVDPVTDPESILRGFFFFRAIISI